MKKFERNCTLISTSKYNNKNSEIYWFPNEKTTIEILEIKPNLFLLQGSKEYFIKDVYNLEDFQKKFGLEGEEYHSRLASMGTFSDYLKEAVPSFELYVLYINSLSSEIVTIDNSLLKKQIDETEKRISFNTEKLKKLNFDRESGLTVGRDIITLKNLIGELQKRLIELKEEKDLNNRLTKEYKKKGVGAIFIMRGKSPSRITNETTLNESISMILDDLAYKNQIIKSQAWQGFKLIIEDLENPTLSLSAGSIGLFDPRALEEILEDYNYNELEELKKELETLFIYRSAVDISIDQKYIKKSSAIAQGISSLMRRAVSKPPSEKELPEPEYNKIPSIMDEGKRLAFTGFILEDGTKKSGIPSLYDFDEQGPQHTLIVGGTGSGKTICASNLAEGALMQNIPVLVLDTSAQWTGFLKPCQNEDILKLYKKFEMKEIGAQGFQGKIFTPNSEFGINLETNLLLRPETTKKDELQQCAYEIAAIIKVICSLTNKETTYIRSMISDFWERGENLDYISLRKGLEDWGKVNEKNVFEAKLKLEELEGYPFLFGGEKLNITDLWKPSEISIVVLNHLADNQKIYTSYFLMRELLSYFYSQPDSSELKLLLIIEEAHRFIPTHTPGIPNELYLFLDRVIRELRRKGVGTIFISHVMTDFKPSIRANTATKIRLRTTYDGDIQRANKDIGSAFANYLPKLETGQGIISYPNYGNPFFVQFRPPLHHPFSLSYEEINEEMRFFKGKDKVKDLIASDVDEIRSLTDRDLRAIKNISPKIYNVVKSIRGMGGIGYTGDLSKLLSSKFREIKDKLEDIPSSKINALKELSPDMYEIIQNLREILGTEIEVEIPDEELVLNTIKELNDETGLPPKPSDIVTELGWGWKKANEVIDKLENQGRIKKKKDSKDKRVKRLVSLD